MSRTVFHTMVRGPSQLLLKIFLAREVLFFIFDKLPKTEHNSVLLAYYWYFSVWVSSLRILRHPFISTDKSVFHLNDNRHRPTGMRHLFLRLPPSCHMPRFLERQRRGFGHNTCQFGCHHHDLLISLMTLRPHAASLMARRTWVP